MMTTERTPITSPIDDDAPPPALDAVVAAVEAVADELPENPNLTPAPTLIDRLRGWLTGQLSEAGLADRLREVDGAIARHPEAALNYVTRGELLLRAGLPEAALADFQQGYLLANEELQDANWGVVAQVTQDRALRGIQQAERKI
jgi:hypothetical protein